MLFAYRGKLFTDHRGCGAAAHSVCGGFQLYVIALNFLRRIFSKATGFVRLLRPLSVFSCIFYTKTKTLGLEEGTFSFFIF